ncbi:MAG TPA: hypothetical protein VMV18_06080 [bacterium]|nr:hypothetical protein [bacterium]
MAKRAKKGSRRLDQDAVSRAEFLELAARLEAAEARITSLLVSSNRAFEIIADLVLQTRDLERASRPVPPSQAALPFRDVPRRPLGRRREALRVALEALRMEVFTRRPETPREGEADAALRPAPTEAELRSIANDPERLRQAREEARQMLRKPAAEWARWWRRARTHRHADLE